VLLFGVFPVVFAIVVHRLKYRGAMAPMLWLFSMGLIAALLGDPTFDRAALWRLPLSHPHVGVMVKRFVVLGGAVFVLGRFLTPAGFLWLPRKRTRLWLLFCVAYPTLSAVPQGIIWRVFFTQRYATLFGENHAALIVVGAAAFALAHLAFWNRTAIIVTGAGGALFLSTYLETHSMLLAAAEHGAYGIAAFSAGLGMYLYRGAPVTQAHTEAAGAPAWQRAQRN